MTKLMSDSASPKVAVVLSVYNPNLEYLRVQLDSVFSQEASLEVYVRDDGSTDCSALPYLSGLADEGRITLLRGENLGFTQSFMEALRAAYEGGAEYFAFCDQDDRWLPGRIPLAVSALEEAGARGSSKPVLHYSRYVFCDKDLNPVREEAAHPNGPSFRNALVDAMVFGMVMTFNRSACEAALMGDPKLLAGHDWWVYLVAAGLGTVLTDSTITNLYRRNASSVTVSSFDFLALLVYRIKNLLFGNELARVKTMHSEFARCFSDRLSSQDRKTLELFLPGGRILKAIRKIFYPKPFRQNAIDELGCRAMFLVGKI